MGSGAKVLNEHATPEITSATVWFLGALVSLIPFAGIIYWFAKTYATEKFVCVEVEALRGEMTTLSLRLDTAQKEISNAHVASARVETELAYIRRGLDALSGRIDRVLECRPAVHQPLILGEDNKR
jgi:hypothetical protein